MINRVFWAVAVTTLLFTSSRAKLGSVEVPLSGENAVTDEKVRDALFGSEEPSAGGEVDLKAFTMEYLINNKLQLGLEEASAILSRLADKKKDGGFLLVLGKVFDLANALKVKVHSCPELRDQKLDGIIFNKDTILVAEAKARLVSLLTGFQCAKLEEAPPVVSKADLGGPNKLFSNFQYQLFDEIKSKMKKDPMSVYKMLVGYLKSFGLVSKESSPMVALVAEQLLARPEFVEYGVSFVETVEMFMKSESGKRFVQIIPQLLTADTETALELFAREADYNQEAFFGLLQNGDVAAKFLKSVARMIVSLTALAKESLADNMKLAVANGFLISNNFPPIDRKNLLRSTCGIVEKSFKVFSTLRLDLDLYKEVKAFTDEFEKLYFKFDKFEILTDEEIENILGKFLQDNVLEPVQDAWLGSRHLTREPDCAEPIMCLFNAQVKKDNEIKRGVTKGLSVLMAYSWSTYDEDVDYSRLYAAMWNGYGVKSCSEIYVASPKTCDVFTEKRQKLAMSLNYEHNEL